MVFQRSWKNYTLVQRFWWDSKDSDKIPEIHKTLSGDIRFRRGVLPTELIRILTNMCVIFQKNPTKAAFFRHNPDYKLKIRQKSVNNDQLFQKWGRDAQLPFGNVTDEMTWYSGTYFPVWRSVERGSHKRSLCGAIIINLILFWCCQVKYVLNRKFRRRFLEV